MPDDLKNSQLRTLQYFYVDGSFEFGLGLLCLILAVFFYAETHVQGWLSAIVDSSLVLVMIGGFWLINRLIKLLKERLTWPRTGYITYNRQNDRTRGWRIALGLVTGGLVGALAANLATTPNLHIAVLPLLSGVLLGFVMVVLGWRTSILRFHLLALLSTVLGVALAYSSIENIVGLAIYYLVFGLVLFACGACVLRTYLLKNPLPSKERPDEL
ncbi:MAG TPA: hypothetical protein VF359_08040 [Anaerolineales bacterium]